MPNKNEGCICTLTTGLSKPPLCPQHTNASRDDLLRQLAEQGEKLKAAEADLGECLKIRGDLRNAFSDYKGQAEKRVGDLEAERYGLKARIDKAEAENRLMNKTIASSAIEIFHLEQRIAGAKVCSHIYTRVALTSTTNCPACTNGIVWPKPAESKGVNE